MFRLNIAPHILFGGAYILPENSKYFSLAMFAKIDSILYDCKIFNYTPLLGGTLINELAKSISLPSRTWKYEGNCDPVTNKHGRVHLSDLCRRNKGYQLQINMAEYIYRTYVGGIKDTR